MCVVLSLGDGAGGGEGGGVGGGEGGGVLCLHAASMKWFDLRLEFRRRVRIGMYRLGLKN